MTRHLKDEIPEVVAIQIYSVRIAALIAPGAKNLIQTVGTVAKMV